MTDSHLPPLGADHVFSVSASAIIDAPIDRVWETLLDFPAYGEWNSFVRTMTLVTPAKAPLADQTAAVGAHILMRVHMPPTMGEPVGMFSANSALCEITHIDADAHRAAWKMADSPAWLLRTERWQALSVDEATGKTRYETVEVFGGILAYITNYFFGDKLREAFRAFADTLKARAEQS